MPHCAFRRERAGFAQGQRAEQAHHVDRVVGSGKQVTRSIGAAQRSESAEAKLGALFTLAREESIAEVRVAGRVVFSGAGP